MQFQTLKQYEIKEYRKQKTKWAVIEEDKHNTNIKQANRKRIAGDHKPILLFSNIYYVLYVWRIPFFEYFVVCQCHD